MAITLRAPDERHKLRAVEKLTRTRLGPDDGHGPEARSRGRHAQGRASGNFRLVPKEKLPIGQRPS